MSEIAIALLFLADAADVGVVLTLVGLLVGLFVTVVWIVFPFLVNSHFKEVQALIREGNSYLKFLAEREKGRAAREEHAEQIAELARRITPPVQSDAGRAINSKAGETFKIDA